MNAPGPTPATSLSTRFREFRLTWKSLVLTDVVFKIIAFVVLTPLVGVLFRVLIALSGSAVLSDQDILFFFLGPVGWFCFIFVGALWLGIVALEQASLMGILCAATADKRLRLLDALRFARDNAWPVLQVAARIVGLTLLAIAPFLAVAGVVYFLLLTQHDINYYLSEKPPVFMVAIGLGGIIVVGMAALLLRLYSGWFFALPLVLFEDVHPGRALRVSVERAVGHRRAVLGWLLGWLLATWALSAVATVVIGLLARLVVPSATASLDLLAVAIGLVVLVWAVVNLAVNLLSTTTLAAILFSLYRQLAGKGELDILRLRVSEGVEGDAALRITRRRLIAAGAVGAAVAVGIGGFAVHSVRLDDNVKIMAHRGSSKEAPENTMAAILKAIDAGADYVEIDVQETADGEVVVFHDSDFMRASGVSLKLWDATMEDLKDIDIGSWFAPEFADQRVPTLAEVLRACKGKIGVNIELKYYGHDEQLEQRVADIVDSSGMASDVVLMSLEASVVRKMKSIRPNWQVGQLMSVSAGDLDKIEADFLAVNAAFANRRLVRDAHGSGKEVYVWTVDDAPTMSTMIGRGVDGLLTNKPALAISVREQRARMSPPERLLLELAGVLGTTSEIGEM